MPRKETDWEVGPALKDKPGSQGTLFRGGTKYSSDARFPRGYTPERQAEVRALIKPTGWREENTQAAATQRREIADTVARSTVPADHLKGLQWAHVPPNTGILSHDDDTVAGAHFPARGNRDENMIAVKPAYTRTSTVIHEIGHHVSHSVVGNQHPYDENGHSGPEEAFADNYAEQHFRDRRGRRQDRGTYGGGKFAGHIERTDEFWNGYHKNRSHEMYRDHVDASDAEYYKKYPEEKQHPDGSYDEPLISKPYTMEHEKPEMHINPDALPHDKEWWA